MVWNNCRGRARQFTGAAEFNAPFEGTSFLYWWLLRLLKEGRAPLIHPPTPPPDFTDWSWDLNCQPCTLHHFIQLLLHQYSNYKWIKSIFLDIFVRDEAPWICNSHNEGHNFEVCALVLFMCVLVLLCFSFLFEVWTWFSALLKPNVCPSFLCLTITHSPCSSFVYLVMDDVLREMGANFEHFAEYSHDTWTLF